MATSATKPSPTANIKPHRLPAPTLFVGPPSRNASNLSVSRQHPHAADASPRDPLPRHKSALSRSNNTPADDDESSSAPPHPHIHPTAAKSSDAAVESRWRDMQNSLNEVELTAQSSTHVFGASHARALEDLRKAQIELARAWGRGNQDDRDPTHDADFVSAGNRFQGADELARDRSATHHHHRRHRTDTNASSTSASTALSGESGDDVMSPSGRSQLEDETKQDIKLASERRAANEAYFQTVEGGVREVVKKLEMVAEAMRGVEGETRSLWSESESMTTGGSSANGGGVK